FPVTPLPWTILEVAPLPPGPDAATAALSRIEAPPSSPSNFTSPTPPDASPPVPPATTPTADPLARPCVPPLPPLAVQTEGDPNGVSSPGLRSLAPPAAGVPPAPIATT